MRDMTPLDKWLDVETWHTFHPLDEERFYKSVYRLMAINTPHPEPEQLRDYILAKKTDSLEANYLEQTISRYVSKYDVIYSFIYENQIKL